MKTSLLRSHTIGKRLLALMSLLALLPARSDAQSGNCCPDTNGVKWVQRPNLSNGLDVNATFSPFDPNDFFGPGRWILADDFPCTNAGPITDIHLWGSWLNNLVDYGASYTLAIWSDVPAGTSGFSHPGQVLWTQTFTNGQYAICPYTNVFESFYNGYDIFPGDQEGSSTNLFYLCFDSFRTNFFQTGQPNAPTNYWLSVTVQSPAGQYFGWKSSSDAYNDAAVAWDNYPAVPTWSPIYDLQGAQLNLAFKVATGQTSPTCVETNGAKYVQWPNLNNGFDIWNSSNRPPAFADGPWILADDFICTNSGPITDIHLWGSWYVDQVATNKITFWLGIYDDVPVSGTNSYSRPGNLLYQQYFAPGQYAETFWGFGSEHFLDPGQPSLCCPETKVYYYCFYPNNWFQNGTFGAPKTYWLAAFAQLPFGATNYFGWKTTTNVQHDISVHASWPGIPPNFNPGWTPNSYFITPNSVSNDLAFKITTGPSTPCCPDAGGVKYQQGPDLTNGIDVIATFSPPDPQGLQYWVLADDFPCTNSGPITDIHVWGSWLNDLIDFNPRFTLAIWSDVASNAFNGFSHPGDLLWTQSYTNGQYTLCPYTNRIEVFGAEEPGFGLVYNYGYSTNLYYLCFNADPANTFIQQGTPNAKTNYWLSLTVQSTGTNYFGWKSSPISYNDSAVVALSGNFYPAQSDWGPMYDLQFNPLNMAFKITTSTNACPAPQLLCSNVTIQCGNTIPTNPPGYVEQCCGSVLVNLLNSVTNSAGCGKVITRTWQAVEQCSGASSTCTQTVTVLPSAPTLMCSNLTLTCGATIPTNPPAYIDSCCTNVTVTLINSSTNINGCNRTIFRTWQAVNCCTNVTTCTQTVMVVASPPQILCSNSSVQCGAAIPTNPPSVVDLCCSNVTVTLLSSSTNVSGCGKTITRIWQALDCCTNSATCTQTVTVVATAAQILCSNVTIQCGSPVPTNPPTVISSCCSNVTATLVGGTTITNGCGRYIYLAWQAVDCCSNSLVCTQIVTMTAGNAIVVPNVNANVEGNIGNAAPFDLAQVGLTSQRYQQVYAASEFTAMPAGGAFITAIAFRPDAGWGGFSTTLPAIQINLSTTAKAPDGLSQTFASNPGPDDTVVFNGPLPLSSSALGNPRVFDIKIQLTTPFFYNRAVGNLLMDVRNSGGGLTTSFDAVSILGDSVSRSEGVPYTAASGDPPDSVGLVTEFIIGPSLQLLCTNITVNCGSPLPTNPPAYIDLCCTNVTVTLINSLTNVTGCGRTISQTWQAVDCCNNSTNCARTITVLPSGPTLLCTNITIQCGTPVPTNPPAYIDLCCTNVTVTLLSSLTNGTACSNVIYQAWRAVDCCTNSMTCTQTVTVIDTTPPNITCPTNRTVTTCGTNVIVSWTVGANDNCALGGTSSSPASGSSFLPNTTNTVTCTAWDQCNNTNTCTFKITVTRPVLGTLAITNAAGTIILKWTDGILLQATNLLGPWTEVPSAPPPTYSTAATGIAKFYRLCCRAP